MTNLVETPLAKQIIGGEIKAQSTVEIGLNEANDGWHLLSPVTRQQPRRQLTNMVLGKRLRSGERSLFVI